MDAWDHLGTNGGATDTPEMKRCTLAWIEWAMFPKCVLRAEERGVRTAHAYVRAKNCLERWMRGDREGLWKEVAITDAHSRRKSKSKGGMKPKMRE